MCGLILQSTSQLRIDALRSLAISKWTTDSKDQAWSGWLHSRTTTAVAAAVGAQAVAAATAGMAKAKNSEGIWVKSEAGGEEGDRRQDDRSMIARLQ